MDIHIIHAFLENKDIGFNDAKESFEEVVEGVALRALSKDVRVLNDLESRFYTDLKDTLDPDNLETVLLSQPLLEKITAIKKEGGSGKELDDLIDKIIAVQTVYKAAHPLLNLESPDFLKKDRLYISSQVKDHPEILQFIDISLMEDSSFMVDLMVLNPEGCIANCPKDTKLIEDFYDKLVEKDPSFINLIELNVVYYLIEDHPELINHLSVSNVIKLLKSFPNKFLDFPKECPLRLNRDVSIAAIRGSSVNFQHLSRENQTDPEIMSMALNANPRLVRFLGEPFISDKTFLTDLIKRDYSILEFINKDLLLDKDFIKFLTEFSPYPLRYASRLNDDKAFILELIAINPMCIQFVSERLKNDIEVVEAAINIEPKTIKYASEFLRDDIKLISKVCLKNPDCFAFASKRLKAFEPLVMNVLRQNGLLLEHVDPVLQSKRDVVLAAVQQNGLALRFAPSDLKKVRAIAMAACHQNGLALEFAWKDLKKNKDIIMAALSQNGMAIRFVHPSFTISEDFAVIAVKSNPTALDHIPGVFLSNKKVISSALIANPALFHVIDESLKIDIPFLLQITQHNPDFLIELPSEILHTPEFVNELKAAKILPDSIRSVVKDYGNSEIKRYLLFKVSQAYFNKKIYPLVPRVKDEDEEGFQLVERRKKTAKGADEEDIERLEISEIIENYGQLENAESNADIAPFIADVVTRTWSPKVGSRELDAIESERRAVIGLIKGHKKTLKNSTVSQALYRLLSSLDHSQCNAQEKIRLLKLVFSFKDKKQMEDALMLLPVALSLIKKKELLELPNLSTLSATIASRLIEHGFLEAGDLEAFERLMKDPKIRNKNAIFTYANQFNDDPVMKATVKSFIKQIISPEVVLEDGSQISTFALARHRANSYRELLGVKNESWNQTLDTQNLKLEIEITNFFSHITSRQEIQYAPNFFRALKDKTFLQRLKDDEFRTELALSDVDRDLINLLISDRAEWKDKIIQAQTTITASGLKLNEIKNRLKKFTKLIEKTYKVVDSEDWQDLFLCGTDVDGSCQRVDGDKSYNQCLMGYVLDGKTRILCLKEKDQGPIAARCLIKVILDTSIHPPKACLFLERSYPHSLDISEKKLLLDFAKAKAEAMGLELYVKQSEFPGLIPAGSPLKDLESNKELQAAPYEYSDGAHGSTKGKYEILGASKVV